jgi:hypothetical protein
MHNEGVQSKKTVVATRQGTLTVPCRRSVQNRASFGYATGMGVLYMNSQHIQGKWTDTAVFGGTSGERRCMSMHRSDVVGELVESREGTSWSATLEASLRTTSEGLITTVPWSDVTSKLVLSVKLPFMIATRNRTL